MLKSEATRPGVIDIDRNDSIIPGPSCSQDQMETMGDRTAEQSEQNIQTCRLCAIEKHEMIPILDPPAIHGDVAKKIRDCFFIVVDETDETKQICESCMETVDKHNEFREKVLRANKILTDSNETEKNRSQRGERESLCYLCCGRFSSMKDLVSHIKGNTNDTKWQCNLCVASFSTKCGLGLHAIAHTGSPVSKNMYWNHCLSCGGRFANMSAYKNHIKGDVGDEKLQCQVCNESHQTKCSLGIHELRHKRKSENECLSCGAHFSQLMELKYHMKGPEDNEELPCNKCNASFRTKCALDEHKMMNQEKCQSIFPCRTCGKIFKEKIDLEAHASSHVSEKPYKCEICEKSFKKKFDMEIHRKVHAGDRPYKCAICKKGFVNTARLREHKIQFHTDEKRYKCGFCDKAFKTPVSRSVHMSIHTGTKALKCDMCDGSFNRGTEMRNHKILMHNL